jgi:hypothetical protein
MPNHEFNICYEPILRQGFTSIEAAEFLKREFLEVPEWTCWLPHAPALLPTDSVEERACFARTLDAIPSERNQSSRWSAMRMVVLVVSCYLLGGIAVYLLLCLVAARDAEHGEDLKRILHSSRFTIKLLVAWPFFLLALLLG